MKKVLGCVCVLLALTAPCRAQDLADLLKRLKSDDPEVRRLAARSLGELEPKAKDAVPALTAALKDKDLFVRRYSAWALGEIGPDAKAAIPALTAALNDSRKEVVDAAARALGKMGAEALDVLVSTAKDKKKDAATRRRAVEALGNLGPSQAKQTVPVLTEALNDSVVRLQAAGALGALGPAAREAVPTLSGFAKDKDRTFRDAAMTALKQIQQKK